MSPIAPVVKPTAAEGTQDDAVATLRRLAAAVDDEPAAPEIVPRTGAAG